MSTKPKITFADIKSSQIYWQEVWFLATGIIRKMNRLIEITPMPERDYFLNCDPEITDLVLGILSNSANIKKLTTPAPQQRGESAFKYQFRIDRCNEIKKILPNVDFSAILDTKVRNTLEHFDEYLDEFIINATLGGLDPKYMHITYNVGVSDTAVFTPKPFPIRMYEAKTKIFYNFDNKVDLGKIYDIAQSVDNGIQEYIRNETAKHYPSHTVEEKIECSGGSIIPRLAICGK